jgi:hypothetical protein
MIWSSDLGSGWIRWRHDSTALSTRIIPDDAARSRWPTLEQQGERLATDAKAFLKSGAKLWPPTFRTITAQWTIFLASFLFTYGRARQRTQAPKTNEIFQVAIKAGAW